MTFDAAGMSRTRWRIASICDASATGAIAGREMPTRAFRRRCGSG